MTGCQRGVIAKLEKYGQNYFVFFFFSLLIGRNQPDIVRGVEDKKEAHMSGGVANPARGSE